MRNKGLCVALCILGGLLFSTPVCAVDYWTGNGGRGKSLMVNEPKSNNLPPNQIFFTSLVQGYFVTTLSTYSAIAVQDRMHAEDVMRQAELQNESNIQDIGKVLEVDYVLTGSISRTTSALVLTIEIINVQDNRTEASHSATYTRDEIEEGIAVNKATLDLLGKMGVTLTALARTELQQAASRQDIQYETAMAEGIAAQRSGNEIAATALYNQAWAIDSSRMEAANRVSIVSASIRTGNIGQDRRNDIQWRNEWRARLEETERYFDTFFKTFNQPYALIYTTELQYGDTNYREETVPASFTVELLEQSNWTDPVLKTVNTVWQGLNATGRKIEWGFEDWPRSRVSNVSPFSSDSKRLTIAVELVNDQKKVAARQTFEVRGRWEFSFNRDEGIKSFTSSGEAAKTITFPAIKASDLTEGLTLQFTTVNGVPVANASRNGLLMITTRSLYRDAAGFDLSGYDRDGFNREGYNTVGYDRSGFNRAGYDREGYDRKGFDREGFSKEDYTTDGSLYNTAGYNRSGYKRWSPVSSYFEALFTFRPGFDGGAGPGFTIGVLGIYGSFSYNSTSDRPADVSPLGEFVFGYTLNVLPKKNGRYWGLGVPLGAGHNKLENLLVLETGLQLRFRLGKAKWPFEIRGTYRTIGFSDNSFTISTGLCFASELH
ncbi:MAG: hypothetical protein LBL28_06905 [Treponema sp.]|jgi:TolB-like protein|nr:hypothetical protein [Treponema sp.]